MALVSSIVPHQRGPAKDPMLQKLYNDDEIIETLVQRNQDLSNFWFFQQEQNLTLGQNKKPIKITIIHNGDDFVYMLRHLLHAFGINTHIEHFSSYKVTQDDSAITILGACPRIGILVKIEEFLKNKHSHMCDIASIIF